jgi:hypothetical protein
MAWSEDKRARFQKLKSAAYEASLTEAERTELRAYREELDREEEAALAASSAQKDLEVERLRRALEETLSAAETLEQIADAQRALRDEARACLEGLRTRRQSSSPVSA